MTDSPSFQPTDAAAVLRATLDARLAARDRQGAVTAALDAVEDGSLEIGDLYTGVLGPLLVDTGSAWQRGAERVWEEHFASATVRTIVEALYPQVMRVHDEVACDGKRVLLGVPLRRAARSRPAHGGRPLRARGLGRRLPRRRHAHGRDHRRRADAGVRRGRAFGVDALQPGATARGHRRRPAPPSRRAAGGGRSGVRLGCRVVPRPSARRGRIRAAGLPLPDPESDRDASAGSIGGAHTDQGA